MSETPKNKFSSNLIAITGFITAIAGLITILHQAGVMFPKDDHQQNKTTVIIDTVIAESKGGSKIIVNNSLTKTNYKEERKFNIAGYWNDNVNNGRYYFSHNTSNTVNFQEYSLVQGSWIVSAEGRGTIYKNELSISYLTMYGTSGSFNGIISEDTRTIEGVAKDGTTGIRMPMKIRKE